MPVRLKPESRPLFGLLTPGVLVLTALLINSANSGVVVSHQALGVPTNIVSLVTFKANQNSNKIISIIKCEEYQCRTLGRHFSPGIVQSSFFCCFVFETHTVSVKANKRKLTKSAIHFNLRFVSYHSISFSTYGTQPGLLRAILKRRRKT
ncbi:hypothetical protein GQX74_014632 [Glossina fuscipes]|nr:hypothetical protein GQX74_014632 [Glossina fuscipes]